MDAEREIVQLKRVQFMQDKVGQEYDGVVSGVTGFGFFVELHEVFVEGLVHVGTLGDDFYEHDEAHHLLRGRRTRRMFRVGDPVRVAVAGVSLARRQIDFVLADPEETRRTMAKTSRDDPDAWSCSPAPRDAAAPETDPARRSRVVEAVERASPAVVNISTEQTVVQRPMPFGDPFFEQFFRDFFDARPRRSTRTSLARA